MRLVSLALVPGPWSLDLVQLAAIRSPWCALPGARSVGRVCVCVDQVPRVCDQVTRITNTPGRGPWSACLAPVAMGRAPWCLVRPPTHPGARKTGPGRGLRGL